MGRGRKKLPQEILDLRGTARKDRARPAAVTGSGVAPVQCWTFPGYEILTERAKGIYRRLCKSCMAIKILEAQDLVQLIAYAREYDIYLTAIADVEKNGPVTVTEDAKGKTVAYSNPYVKIANNAIINLTKIGSNFGFSPVDRQKLKTPAAEDPREKIRRIMVEFDNEDSGPDNQ